MKSVSIH